MQKDHGYNPPPVWTMTGKFFGSFGTRRATAFSRSLACIDIFFHLGTRAAVRLGLRLARDGRRHRVLGLQCARELLLDGRRVPAPGLDLLAGRVAVSAEESEVLPVPASRSPGRRCCASFPDIFIGGIAIIVALRAHPAHPRATAEDVQAEGPARLASTPTIDASSRGCCVCARRARARPASWWPARTRTRSSTTTRCKTHSKTPLTNTMGLETMIEHDWDGRMRFTRDDNLDDPFAGLEAGPARSLPAAEAGLHRHHRASSSLWTVWALRRTKLLWVGLALSTRARDLAHEPDLLLLLVLHGGGGARHRCAVSSARPCS